MSDLERNLMKSKISESSTSSMSSSITEEDEASSNEPEIESTKTIKGIPKFSGEINLGQEFKPPRK